jgi:hypothetical protein
MCVCLAIVVILYSHKCISTACQKQAFIGHEEKHFSLTTVAPPFHNKVNKTSRFFP